MVLPSVSYREGGHVENNVIPAPASSLQGQSYLFNMFCVNLSWQVTPQVFEMDCASNCTGSRLPAAVPAFLRSHSPSGLSVMGLDPEGASEQPAGAFPTALQPEE